MRRAGGGGAKEFGFLMPYVKIMPSLSCWALCLCLESLEKPMPAKTSGSTGQFIRLCLAPYNKSQKTRSLLLRSQVCL